MANAQQVRLAVDAGRTRDKVRAPDPAAAPLGTDDEAAGRPVPTAWLPPEKGDHLADGDPSVGALYEVHGEEDNRAPATAPPGWRTWIGFGVLLLALAVIGAALGA